MSEATTNRYPNRANPEFLWAAVNDLHHKWDEGELANEAQAVRMMTRICDQFLGNVTSNDNMMNLPDGRVIDIHEAFVTMTVPVSLAMRVVDTEEGDNHCNAVMNLEGMLAQDLEEEYGIDTEMAFDYHNPDIDAGKEVK